MNKILGLFKVIPVIRLDSGYVVRLSDFKQTFQLQRHSAIHQVPYQELNGMDILQSIDLQLEKIKKSETKITAAYATRMAWEFCWLL